MYNSIIDLETICGISSTPSICFDRVGIFVQNEVYPPCMRTAAPSNGGISYFFLGSTEAMDLIEWKPISRYDFC